MPLKKHQHVEFQYENQSSRKQSTLGIYSFKTIDSKDTPYYYLMIGKIPGVLNFIFCQCLPVCFAAGLWIFISFSATPKAQMTQVAWAEGLSGGYSHSFWHYPAKICDGAVKYDPLTLLCISRAIHTRTLVLASSVAIINRLLFIVGQIKGVSHAMEFKKIIHFLYIP